VAAATEGVTASFIKELVRRSALAQVEKNVPLLHEALADLLDEKQALDQEHPRRPLTAGT
jgi:hypothetical protein